MGYLDRLAARLVEPRPLIRPRPLSRFEAVDPLNASMAEPGSASEDEALPAPPARARPAPVAQERGEESLASSMRTPRAGVDASPKEQRRPSVIREISDPPSVQDASREVPKPASQGVRTTPREGPAPASAERPASVHAVATAVPAIRTASPRPDAAPMPLPALPAAAEQPRTPVTDMASRIAPWREPTDAAARPSIDTRTTAAASTAATAPKRREPAATATDPSAVVQVTIGRLELRSPEASPRRPSAKPARAAPRMSLQDYLQRRAGGHGR
ncbi:hypothetical protein [Variovorax ginsengisoli]|jgi:hypothetical protein|uniref:Uncharacterized protein n=1 Tax=Variovorax ginsengisoli TaxID=363844 RepID=A0ABT8S5S9_9BURK|nr:hypothetical protein [Variovorax ginsengisoli]MDN8615101.1 hypothetical protein [Variovorax ginsengisoli]MDO1534271.1 hypothetical protein [Variovorax ginsengisoli]